MKIEKVNDNQIRCTLTKEDLADRQIKLSELAYGSEKAKTLFRDMMQQANYEFGFEANDIPLMVEAIPLSSDTIILVITKVEYPEELDTRFSKFSEAGEDIMYDENSDQEVAQSQGADDILGLFKKIREENAKPSQEVGEDSSKKDKEKESDNEKPSMEIPVNLTKLFEFRNLEQIERLAHVLDGYYNGDNDLYKNEVKHRFYLTVSKSEHSPEEFNKVCNIISEYGRQQKYTTAVGAYYEEHGKVIVKQNALQVLAQI